MRISVMSIGDSGEARLLRDLLETQGHDVRVVWVGKPSDVFEGFDFFGAAADAAILAAHGDDKGIVFPEMAPDVDTLELPDDRLTPDILRNNLRLAPPLVLSTACGSGIADFAAAFTQSGTQTYVAPDDYPEGADIAIWVAVFFRELGRNGIEAAVARANAAVDTESSFRLFD